jgi:hypothetical protein
LEPATLAAVSEAKQGILTKLTFGKRVAEEEVDALASYFVETDQWRRLLSGEVDVVFGPKGAGKSAMYSTLLQRDGDLFNEGVILVSAENPRGTPAFKDLVADPPTSESEFASLWKLYALSLIASVLIDYGLDDSQSRDVKTALAAEGLLPVGKAPLRARVRSILDWVRRALSIEAQASVDPATGVPTVAAKISIGEPSVADRAAGTRSIDSLLEKAASALAENQLQVWLLFDRLDVAFAESRDLEANGLRALFKCYLDLLSEPSIRLKIFLRSDVWADIMAKGFREGSHITRRLDIRWSNPALLNLIVRRLLNNEAVVRLCSVTPDEVLKDSTRQREFFDELVPDQVDAGKNPKSFEWILGRVQDGTGTVAPREVIHLLTEARDAQLQMLERGDPEPPDRELLSRQALREALWPVSRTRLEQTLYAEYPESKRWMAALDQEKTEQTPETLASIWGVTAAVARVTAQSLVEIGFFEQRGTKEEPRFWVPFLYRPGLNLVQGSASAD